MTASEWWTSHAPAAPARVHLLLAALMWSGVGAALTFFGIRWVRAGHGPHAWIWLIAAIGAGVIKSRLVLDKASARMIDRIRERGDGRCLGGFLSWRSWAFVAGMVVLGRVLRAGVLPTWVVGLIYAGVGAALLLASRRFWIAWSKKRGRESF